MSTPFFLANTAPASPYFVALVSLMASSMLSTGLIASVRSEGLVGDLGGVLGYMGEDRRLYEALADCIRAVETTVAPLATASSMGS